MFHKYLLPYMGSEVPFCFTKKRKIFIEKSADGDIHVNFHYNPSMGIARILKPILFIYETVRLVILAFTLAFLLPGTSAIPWLAFTAPGALFPLMALFLWLDASRYKAYLPLYIAGKCIGIFSLLGWAIIFRQVTMLTGFGGVLIIAEFIFLSGDLFALAAILVIFKSVKKLNDKQTLSVSEEINNAANAAENEGKKCE